MKIQAISGALGSNTFIVEYQDTILIIDAGASLADVLTVLNGRKPNAILLTHEHFDHILNIGDYVDKWQDYPIYCHSATIEELKTNELNSLLSFYGEEVKQPKSFSNFNTTEKLPHDIKPIFCPGHSAGSVCYLIKDILFTGDVLFANTIGRTDLMKNGSELMQQTLKKLKDIKFVTACHGHGENSTYAVQQKNISKHIIK